MGDFNTDDINDLILKDIAIEECKERIAELEQKLVWAQSAADGRAEHPWKVRCDELEAQTKQLIESILIEVEYYQPNGEYMPETEAFYCDGVVYGLEKAAAIVKAALKEKDDE